MNILRRFAKKSILFLFHKIKQIKIFLLSFVFLILRTNHPCFNLNEQLYNMESNETEKSSSSKSTKIERASSNYFPICGTSIDTEQCCKNFMNESAQFMVLNRKELQKTQYVRRINISTQLHNDLLRPPIA